MNAEGSDIKGIKVAVGEAYRKHIEEYSKIIIAIPWNHSGVRKVAGIDRSLFVDEEIIYETDELTSVCPVSGLPDFYHLKVIMKPHELLPELKSFKFYLMAFRDVGILHEDLAPKILKDLTEVVKPDSLIVELTAKVRGGIGTTVVAKWPIP